MIQEAKPNSSVQIYNFNLEFQNDGSGSPFFAPFPFIFDGRPVEGISCGISSRFAGDMKNEENRLALYNFAGPRINPADVCSVKQIHSRTVIPAGAGGNIAERPSEFSADGMTAQDLRITLLVTAADCLPVYLLDVKKRSFALVHSGWKGTGIAADAAALMKELYGADAGGIAAVLGPCIGACCYKTDAQRFDLFKREFGEQSVRKSGEDFFLDLKAANIKLLSDIGVKNIAVCRDCTFCDERLGSFRRQGADFTHMAALVFPN